MTSTPFIYPLSSSTPLPNFQNHTLLLPVVSIGSVPQLATDLLLHCPQLALEKVARLDPLDCFSFVGPDESNPNDLTTPLELYHNPSLQLVVVQQRSPVFKSKESHFIHLLSEWIKSSGFQQVLILSSIDAAARIDSELTTPLVSLTSSTTTPISTLLTNLFPPFINNNATSSIPGSHLLGPLLSLIPNSCSLLLFTSEGDNRQDAQFMASIVLKNLLQFEINSEFIEPISWNSLFGSELNEFMYG